MNYSGTARTNYVHVINPEGLKKSLEPFEGVLMQEHPDEHVENYFCLLFRTDDGSIPTLIDDPESDEPIEFSFEEHVMPFLADREVLVTMEVGSEKMRYMFGLANAYQRCGDEVKATSISLNSIYRQAAEAFGVDENEIAPCTYTDLAKNMQSSLNRRRNMPTQR